MDQVQLAFMFFIYYIYVQSYVVRFIPLTDCKDYSL